MLVCNENSKIYLYEKSVEGTTEYLLLLRYLTFYFRIWSGSDYSDIFYFSKKFKWFLINSKQELNTVRYDDTRCRSLLQDGMKGSRVLHIFKYSMESNGRIYLTWQTSPIWLWVQYWNCEQANVPTTVNVVNDDFVYLLLGYLDYSYIFYYL